MPAVLAFGAFRVTVDDMRSEEEERLHEALLDRAKAAVDAAAETVAHSEVVMAVSPEARGTVLTSRCAWCGRYRIAERWVVIEGHVSGEIGTTHGICEDCVKSLRETGLSV